MKKEKVLQNAMKKGKRELSVPDRADYFERMIDLADEFFGANRDPSQISVDRRVRKTLVRIHPRTMSERRTRRGPVAWGLVIPTTSEIMRRFLGREITERQLLTLTPLHERYTSLYLCSALVLPEFRKKGYAKRLILGAVRDIRRDHPIEVLFYWSFSGVGSKLAKAIARETGLPLIRRRRSPSA